MQSRFLLERVSLADEMPNIHQKVISIINESNSKVQTLTGHLHHQPHHHRYSMYKIMNQRLTGSFLYRPRDFKLLELCHQRLSTIILNPIKEKKQMAINNNNNNKKTKQTKKDIKLIKWGTSRNQPMHQYQSMLHQRTFSITDQHNMRSDIDSRCKDLYSTCVDFSSSIRKIPKTTLELNEDKQSQEDLNEVLQIKHVKGKTDGNRLINHAKIIRKTNIITKVSNELAHDARNMLSEVFLSNSKQIDYSQAKVLNSNTVKRIAMINKAHKIIRQSENDTKKILNS